jgi:hypothetical protein
MWLKTVLLKSLGLQQQQQGYSLIDALREDEEELGFDHNDSPIVVQKRATQKQVSIREPSPPPLSPSSSWSSGLPADPPSPPPGSGPLGRFLIRRNAWPIHRQRVSDRLEDASERIYSARWLRYVIQLSRDALANAPVILNMVLLQFWSFVTSPASSYKKIAFWVPPAGISVALAELAMRKYVST